MKKRLALSILTVAVISLLVSAATLALFSDKKEVEAVSFAAGTVTLGEPTDVPVEIGPLAPGDGGNCEFEIEYIGSLEAWVGYKWETSGELFDGLLGLYITRVSATIENNVTGLSETITHEFDEEGVQIAAADDVEADALPWPKKVGKVNQGDKARFKVSYMLPWLAGNEYQDKEGTVTFKIYAVQTAHNELFGFPISWQ